MPALEVLEPVTLRIELGNLAVAVAARYAVDGAPTTEEPFAGATA